MAKKRVTLYVDKNAYERAQQVLSRSPSPYPISQLISELLSDWLVEAAQVPEELGDMSVEEKREFINAMATRQFLELASEVRSTLHKVGPEGGTVQ